VLGAVLPFRRRVPAVAPAQRSRWMTLVAATAIPFTLQAVALQFALQRAQGGYVMALSSMSTLIASALAGIGTFVLRYYRQRSRCRCWV